MKEFRQLTVEDTAEYHKVLIDGYAAIKDFPITFDAIDFTEEESKGVSRQNLFPLKYGFNINAVYRCGVNTEWKL